MNSEPRILVISYNFIQGDAITFLNLFSSWSKSNLFCLSAMVEEYAENFESCYRIGNKEIKYSFPIKYFTPVKKSGIYKKDGESKYSSLEISYGRLRNSLRYLYGKLIIPTIQYLGLLSSRLSIHVSTDLAAWIKKIDPDYIYTSVGSIEMAKFVLELRRHFPEIKLITHTYDNWIEPTYKVVNRRTIVRKSDKLLSEIFEQSEYLFAISDKMAREYTIKYRKKFHTFANAVDPIPVTAVQHSRNSYNAVYLGKIWNHNLKSIKLFVKAISKINAEKNFTVYFTIYTNSGKEIQNSIGRICDKISIHEWVPQSEVPSVLGSADILYLPIAISKDSVKFNMYSMSTKMSEYLSSMRPIIYMGPDNIAMTEFLRANNCAYIVTSENEDLLCDVIRESISNQKDVRVKLDNAQRLFEERFKKDSVSKSMKELLQADNNIL